MSKKGPHKCIKTLTRRLTPKYVCPTSQKGGVTSLSTLPVRTERVAELEAAGEVRKPPKQEREEESTPIQQLEKKEKARQKLYLARMAAHPQTIHADEDQEATYKKPDTRHYDDDEEAVEKSLALDSRFIDRHPYDALYISDDNLNKSLDEKLFISSSLVKARKEDPNDPKGAIESQWKSDLPFATSVKDFKREFRAKFEQDPPSDLINKFQSEFKDITGYNPTSKARAAYFKDLKSEMFTIGPPPEPTTEVVRHTGKTAIPDPLQTPARYGGSEKRIMIQPGEMYTKPITKPLAGREKDILLTDKQVRDKKRQEGMQAQLGFGAVKRFDLTTEEGRRKKIEGMMLGLEGLAWLLPTTAGARILGGGAKVLAPGTVKAISTLGKTLSGAKVAAHSKTANALVALLIAASSPGAKGLGAIKTIEAASKAKNVAQITKILETGAQHSGKLKVATRLSNRASRVGGSAPKVGSRGRTAAKTGSRTGARTGTSATSSTTGTQLAAPTTGQTIAGGIAAAGMGATSGTSTSTTAPSSQQQSHQQSQQQTQTAQQTAKPTGRPGGRHPTPRPTRKPPKRRVPPIIEGEEEGVAHRPRQDRERGIPSRVAGKAPGKRKHGAKSQRHGESRDRSAERAASRVLEDYYQHIGGEKKKYERLAASVSSYTFSEYKDLWKSKSYVKTFGNQVLQKRMSLKEALNKVPWWMQAELIDYLRRRV